MQQNNIAETVIGAIVVAVAVIFLAFAYYRTGSGSFTSGYELNARLPKVDGLGVGTDVRLAGIKIGTISDLTLDPKTYLATVHMSIRDDIKIPADSSLLVTSSSLLGSSYLGITPGGDEKMLPPGGYFSNVQGSIDLMNLVGRIAGGDSTSNQAPAKPKAQAPQTQGAQPQAPQQSGP